MRWWLGVGFGLVVGILLAWWAVRGQPRHAVAVSGSMEPSIPAPIQWVHCDRCQIRFGQCQSALDLERPIVCHLCGDTQTRLDDRMQVPPSIAYLPHSGNYQIGDLAVFDDRLGKGIKRIVGAPADLVSIEEGDLIVNGVRFQKGLRAFLSQAILVDTFDQNKHPNSRWEGDNQHYASSLSELIENTTWHRFHYGKTLGLPDAGYAILDDYWLNQGEKLRPVEVEDFGIVLESLELPDDSIVDIVLQSLSAKQHFQLTRQLPYWILYRCDSSDQPQSTPRALQRHELARWKHPSHSLPWFCLAKVDQRWIGGISSFPSEWAEDIERTSNLESPIPTPAKREANPISLRFESRQSKLDRMHVLRDTYYRASFGQRNGIVSERSPGWTVLGDNVSISDDSRTDFPGGIPSQNLRGKVVPNADPLHQLRRQIHLYYDRDPAQVRSL